MTEPSSPRARRGRIVLEDAEIIAHEAFAGRQYILRVHSPRAADRARPGSFAHLTCDPAIPLRRPLSIMRADRVHGWLEFLYKPIGAGLAKLAEKQRGARLSMLAPIGRGFEPDPARPRLLAIGGGVGIPPMIFLAEQARARPDVRPLVLMGSEVPFPFDLVTPQLEVDGIPVEASLAVRTLEDCGVPSRLASNAELPGSYRGHVPELARSWLASLSSAALGEVQMFGCGPEPMLRATAALAREFALPCQLALEEYMACGVGGCAGCTVRVHTADGPAMKRVCVDGPVFDAREVYPP
jgi:dihydroorotate dehydrogenase electron transfer subunit